MDVLTHSLFGLALARAGLSRRFGRGTTALLVVSSNLPDLDALQALLHPDESAWLRRTHTHSVLGGPLLAVALGLVWWAASKRRMPARVAVGLSLLGVAGHVFLDLLNSYGVVALWPFSLERFELAWVYIIDLAMWAILLLPLALAPLLRARLVPARVYQATVAAWALYVALCAAGHHRAGRLLQGELAREGRAASFTFTHVFPEALGPHRWRAVAREGDTWRTWLVHVLDGRMELVQSVRTDEADPRLAAARATPRARSIERFFKAPVWTISPDGRGASCTDLRFSSAVIDRGGEPFTYRFDLGPPAADP